MSKLEQLKKIQEDRKYQKQVSEWIKLQQEKDKYRNYQAIYGQNSSVIKQEYFES